MPKNASQKQKMLMLLQILMQETDEEHPMSLQTIQYELEERGVLAERKSLYNDIDVLCEMGYDIIYSHPQRGYYLASRDFELVELKMLSDTAMASRFLSQKKKRELIAKLGNLCSRHQATKLYHSLNFTQGSFFENESVYYTLDTLYQAILNHDQVSFFYYHYDKNKQKKYSRDNDRYEVSPIALVWDEARYYLLAYDKELLHERTFRLDLMEKTDLGTPMDEEARSFVSHFDLSSYVQATFSMYAGPLTQVTLSFDSSMISAMMDRFGKDITLFPAEDGMFSVHVTVALSPQFYGWLCGLSPRVKLIGPEYVVEKLKDHTNQFLQIHSMQQEHK